MTPPRSSQATTRAAPSASPRRPPSAAASELAVDSCGWNVFQIGDTYFAVRILVLNASTTARSAASGEIRAHLDRAREHAAARAEVPPCSEAELEEVVEQVEGMAIGGDGGKCSVCKKTRLTGRFKEGGVCGGWSQKTERGWCCRRKRHRRKNPQMVHSRL